MDTRSKILDPAALAAQAAAWRAAGERVAVVESSFDPLLAEHAAQLEPLAAAGRVVAIVRDGPDPILPAAVRAELAASLRAVSAVLKPGAGEPDLAGCARISFLEQDEKTARAFVAHVHARSGARAAE